MSAHRKKKSQLFLEALEERCNPTPFTQIGNTITLPGANSDWQYIQGGGSYSASPVIANLGSGPEALVTGGDGNLYGYQYNAATRTFVQNRVYSTGQFTTPLQATPVVVSLGNGHTGVFIGGRNGFVFGWDAVSQQILPGWPQQVSAPWGATSSGNFPQSIFGALAAADLDGDGSPEIIVASINQEVTAFHANGSVMWRYNNDDTIVTGIAIGDLNRDGHLDVVIGGDSSQAPQPPSPYWNGGHITALTWDGHREWMKRTNQVIWSSPVLADLNNTGYLDVIVGTGENFPANGNGFPGNLVYALDPQGNDLPGWPFVTTSNPKLDAQTFASPAVGDLLNNGHLDVVIGDRQGIIHAINGQGQQIWQTQASAQPLASSPILADTNNDGIPDVIYPNPNGIAAFSGNNGAPLDFTADSFPHFESAVVGHLKGDSTWQMAVIGHNATSGGTLLSTSFLEFYDLGTESANAVPWPQYRGDATGDAVLRTNTFSDPLISSLYRNVLGRAPSASDFTTWEANFNHAGSLVGPISAIVSSNEARQIQITSWYQKYLNRTPTGSDIASWEAYLAGGQSYANAQANFAGSQEAFNLSGGTNQSWVVYLYNKVLGRNPQNGEEQGWVNGLNTGRYVRSQVAIAFLASKEITQDLARQWYAAYTPGGASAPTADQLEAIGWDLRQGRRTEEQALTLLLAGNGDYVNTQREGSWVRALYQDVLFRAPAPADTANLLSQLEAGAAPYAIAGAIVKSDEARGLLVQSWYQTFLGRAASSGEVANLVRQLDAGARRVDLMVSIMGSNEYFNHAAALFPGSSALDAFINKVFLDAFGHLPAANQTIFWEQHAQNIRVTLPQTAVGEIEFYQVTIKNWFFTYLRRFPNTPPDSTRVELPNPPFGAQNYVDYWNSGGNPDEIVTSILASPEYFNLAQNKGFWYGARWLA